jgi:hypothetical protein
MVTLLKSISVSNRILLIEIRQLVSLRLWKTHPKHFSYISLSQNILEGEDRAIPLPNGSPWRDQDFQIQSGHRSEISRLLPYYKNIRRINLKIEQFRPQLDLSIRGRTSKTVPARISKEVIQNQSFL